MVVMVILAATSIHHFSDRAFSLSKLHRLGLVDSHHPPQITFASQPINSWRSVCMGVVSWLLDKLLPLINYLDHLLRLIPILHHIQYFLPQLRLPIAQTMIGSLVLLPFDFQNHE